MDSSSSQPLATESFSYSWLVDQTPQFDGLEEYLTSSSSPRDTNFNFDTSISRSSSFNIVHADEIFSNGHIMPIYSDRPKTHVEALNTLSSLTLTNSIPISSKSFVCDQEDRVVNYCYFMKKWRKSSKRILRRCLTILRHMCYKFGCSRISIRVDDIDRKNWEIRSLENHHNSVEASPRQNMNKKTEYWRLKKAKSWSNLVQESVPKSPSCSHNVSFDIESLIYEAVLHCKRSIEN